VNLPNRITVGRIFMTPALVVVMGFMRADMQWVAAFLFVAVSLLDLLDGHLARKRGEVTDFGKFVDPIADKLIITAAMVMLVAQRRMEAWALILFLAREFIISAVRLVASGKGVVIAADRFGKWKTFAQTVAVTMMILLKPAQDAALPWGDVGAVIADAATYIALALALYSCWNYSYANRQALK